MKVTGLQIYINCSSNIPIFAASETQRFAKKIQDNEFFFKMWVDLYKVSRGEKCKKVPIYILGLKTRGVDDLIFRERCNIFSKQRKEMMRLFVQKSPQKLQHSLIYLPFLLRQKWAGNIGEKRGRFRVKLGHFWSAAIWALWKDCTKRCF